MAKTPQHLRAPVAGHPTKYRNQRVYHSPSRRQARSLAALRLRCVTEPADDLVGMPERPPARINAIRAPSASERVVEKAARSVVPRACAWSSDQYRRGCYTRLFPMEQSGRWTNRGRSGPRTTSEYSRHRRDGPRTNNGVPRPVATTLPKPMRTGVGRKRRGLVGVTSFLRSSNWWPHKQRQPNSRGLRIPKPPNRPRPFEYGG